MAEVPPFLWADAGTFTSPHAYEVPGSGEVQPYTATATYVNASGQAILPALRLKSGTGNLLALVFPSSTIADGTSSEVSFVPPFGSAAVSAATGGGIPSLPSAFAGRISTDQTLTKNATTTVVFDSLTTNNATVFTGLTAGSTIVTVPTNGVYLLYARIEFNVVNDGTHTLKIVATAAPNVSTMSRVVISDLTGQNQRFSSDTFYPLALDTFQFDTPGGDTAEFSLQFISTGATIDATGRGRLHITRLGDLMV